MHTTKKQDAHSESKADLPLSEIKNTMVGMKFQRKSYKTKLEVVQKGEQSSCH